MTEAWLSGSCPMKPFADPDECCDDPDACRSLAERLFTVPARPLSLTEIKAVYGDSTRAADEVRSPPSGNTELPRIMGLTPPRAS